MASSTDRHLLVAFGLRVRHLRKERGLSQELFAHEAGLDRSYVGGIERGERNLALVNIKRLSEALGVTLSELFAGMEELIQRSEERVPREN